MSNLSGSSNSGSDQDDSFGITTLIIKPLARELKHEVLSHFSAFGNVGICKETKTSCGITKFTFPESAAKVLGIDSHIIAGRSIDVAAANERMMHDVDTALLDLSDDTTTFLDLSDDCILEVLTMKCLELSHLC